MRASLAATTVVVLLALARPAAASDDVLYAAEVKDAEAEVRCGPGTSDQVYPTNRLKKGDIVQVVEDRSDGWLRILPPHGSFSFINTRFVDHPKDWPKSHYEVASDPEVRVPVFVGSDQKPNERGILQGTSLPRGAQVIAIGGPTLIHEDDSWLRIEPPPGEFRFVRQESVRKVDGLGAGQVARAQAPGVDHPPADRPAAINAPAPGSEIASANAIAMEAIKADTGNRWPDAIILYRRYLDVAQRIVAKDAETMKTIRDVQERLPYLVQQVTASGQPAARPPAGVDTYPSSGPGMLYRSGRKVDDVVAYRLESTQGYPILYVTPRPGVNLEQYVGHKVELQGPAVYRGELRGNYMTVVQVRELP